MQFGNCSALDSIALFSANMQYIVRFPWIGFDDSIPQLNKK